MAASAWSIYNGAKEYIGDNTIDLDAGVFRITLWTSAANVATLTLLRYASCSGEIACANGYDRLAGKQLSAVTWATGASAKVRRFDSTAVIFTASGGSLSAIKYAVIHYSTSAGGGPLLAYSKLSSSPFSVTSGNTLTITPAATGIFNLT